MNAGQRGGTVFLLTSPSDRRSGDTEGDKTVKQRQTKTVRRTKKTAKVS